jgi:hypothetical protein
MERMMPICVEVDGQFETREEASQALREAARMVDSGMWIASQPSRANPMIFITEVDEDES